MCLKNIDCIRETEARNLALVRGRRGALTPRAAALVGVVFSRGLLTASKDGIHLDKKFADIQATLLTRKAALWSGATYCRPHTVDLVETHR